MPDHERKEASRHWAHGGSAGNGKLREFLIWDEATYASVTDERIARGDIVPGRGRGGSVSIAAKAAATARASGPKEAYDSVPGGKD